MLKYFLPRQEEFFSLFQASSDALVEVSHRFHVQLNNPNNLKEVAQSIDILEKKAHKITNDTLEKLHKTFITPFDRYDIHRFIKKLDDVIDVIQRTSQRVMIYKLEIVPNEIRSMAALCVQSAEIIQIATGQLHSLKNVDEILELCNKITPLEAEAEGLLLAGVSQLFEHESDLRQLLKTKEIYEYTKSIINGCQVVVNIIKDIVLEYS